MKWEINVGNIGQWEIANGFEAWRVFGKYKRQSIADFGSAAGESVILLCDGEIVAEYIGTLDSEKHAEN